MKTIYIISAGIGLMLIAKSLIYVLIKSTVLIDWILDRFLN